MENLDYFSTINMEELNRLTENPYIPNTQATTSNGIAPVSDDFIKTLVTPKKVKKVRDAMDNEKEAHRFALKILRCIFSKQELGSSNIAGTNSKKALDSNKLNSLKGRLLFGPYMGEYYQ